MGVEPSSLDINQLRASRELEKVLRNTAREQAGWMFPLPQEEKVLFAPSLSEALYDVSLPIDKTPCSAREWLQHKTEKWLKGIEL